MKNAMLNDPQQLERKLLTVFERHGSDGRAITFESLAANIGMQQQAKDLLLALGNLVRRGLVRGRCSDFASSQGARSQTSYSSAVIRITGMAWGWTRLTSAFGSQVRKAKTSVVISPSFAFRTLVQFVHSPANAIRGRARAERTRLALSCHRGMLPYEF